MKFHVYATLGQEVYAPDTIRRLTMEESVPICRAEWGRHFQDKEGLLQWFLHPELPSLAIDVGIKHFRG
jgi:hypothetical protein